MSQALLVEPELAIPQKPLLPWDLIEKTLAQNSLDAVIDTAEQKTLTQALGRYNFYLHKKPPNQAPDPDWNKVYFAAMILNQPFLLHVIKNYGCDNTRHVLEESFDECLKKYFYAPEHGFDYAFCTYFYKAIKRNLFRHITERPKANVISWVDDKGRVINKVTQLAAQARPPFNAAAYQRVVDLQNHLRGVIEKAVPAEAQDAIFLASGLANGQPHSIAQISQLMQIPYRQVKHWLDRYNNKIAAAAVQAMLEMDAGHLAVKKVFFPAHLAPDFVLYGRVLLGKLRLRAYFLGHMTKQGGLSYIEKLPETIPLSALRKDKWVSVPCIPVCSRDADIQQKRFTLLRQRQRYFMRSL